MGGFWFRSILYSERCAYTFCLEPSQNSNVWQPNMSCLNPLWTYFLVPCPCLVPNNDITARGFAWTSLEETAVVNNGLLFFYILMNRRPHYAIFVESEPLSPANSQKPGPYFFSSAATLTSLFLVEIFLLVQESNAKFARHIACCAWSAVKWITRQV